MKRLTSGQKKHLQDIVSTFSKGITDKYTKGALEHEGNLFDKPCHKFMSDEIIDLFTYLHTHLQHIERLKDLLAEAITTKDQCLQMKNLLRAYHLLAIGREDGRAEPHKE